jgi:hypothetical protein
LTPFDFRFFQQYLPRGDIDMVRAATKASSASASRSRLGRSPALGYILKLSDLHRSLDFVSKTVEVFV